MHTNREILERQLETCEDKLKGLSSYLKELKTMCDKHSTPKAQCESDCTEATHNIAFYESEIARIKKELGSVMKMGPVARVETAAGTLLPKTRNPRVAAAVLSSISFVAGALFGSMLKSGKKP